jgi:hypothetical protein
VSDPPVDSEQFEDFVLANAPEFVKGMATADRELAHGETTSLAEARRLLDAVLVTASPT